MADKKFTHKVGLDNLLDFDPVNGILKYGAYEVFAKDVGVTPTRTELKFEDYLKAQKATPYGAGAVAIAPLSAAERDKQMANFEAAIRDGSYTGDVKASDSSIYQLPGFKPAVPDKVRNVSRLGPDSFAVETYDFPNTVDLVNKIGERAQGLKYQGDNGALLQNQSDAKNRREGRASTVLSPSAVNA